MRDPNRGAPDTDRTTVGGPAVRAPGSEGAALGVGAVARRLGIAPPTLRSWGRRYGLEPSGRSDGGHRRYTTADVARLQTVLRLVRQGVPTATAAEAVRGAAFLPELALRSGVRPDRRAAAYGVQDVADGQRLLRTLAERMDVLPLQAAVETALGTAGVVPVWTDLLTPLLTELGEQRQVEVDRLTVEVLAGCLHRYTGQLWTRRPPDPASRPVLLTGLPGEQHALPLLALSAALAEQQVLGQVLGAGVPPAALSAAVLRCRPAAVFVWSSTPGTADAEALGALVRTRPAYPIAIGGPGWSGTKPRGRLRRVTSLGDATAMLVAAVRG